MLLLTTTSMRCRLLIIKPYLSVIIMQRYQNEFGNGILMFNVTISVDWQDFTYFFPSFTYDGQCSVTCGEGQQTREVICVGQRGEHLPDQACSGLERPPSVKACRRPACFTHITWHVTDYGLVSEENTVALSYKEQRFSSIPTLLPSFSALISTVHSKLWSWCKGEEGQLFWYRFEPLPRGPMWIS